VTLPAFSSTLTTVASVDEPLMVTFTLSPCLSSLAAVRVLKSTSWSSIGNALGAVRRFAARWSSAHCARAASLPTPEELEVAELFLRKAASDLAAARTLAAAPDQQDDVVGFHAQQAVEKSLKAVVTIRGLEIPLTHDVDLLLRLLEAGAEKPPDELQEAKSLSPWAVERRYGEMEAVLDREAAVRIAGAVLSWAQALVDAARQPRP